MTSFVPMSARQPFGELDSSRLHGLTSLKNRQNAIPTTPSKSLKRALSPAVFEDEDTENVDPAALLASNKRSKNFDGTPTKQKATPFTFHLDTTINELPKAFSAPRPIKTPASPSTRLHSMMSSTSTITTPTAAGRSPRSKRLGILSRRRTSASPFTRVEPPRSLGSAPFSIDAALSGTIPGYVPPALESPTPIVDNTTAVVPELTPVPTLDEPELKSSWFFDIYEDTEQETLTNIMEHSAGTLDISDDEDQRAARNARGKENIPPPLDNAAAPQLEAVAQQTNEASEQQVAAVLTSTSEPTPRPTTTATKLRRFLRNKPDAMEDTRAPLGDLNPADFADAEDDEAAALADENTQIPQLEDFKIFTAGNKLDVSAGIPSFVTPPRAKDGKYPSKKRTRGESRLSLSWPAESIPEEEESAENVESAPIVDAAPTEDVEGAESSVAQADVMA